MRRKGRSWLTVVPPDTTTTLLLFAHAIYLPAAALGLAEACGCDYYNNCLL